MQKHTWRYVAWQIVGYVRDLHNNIYVVCSYPFSLSDSFFLFSVGECLLPSWTLWLCDFWCHNVCHQWSLHCLLHHQWGLVAMKQRAPKLYFPLVQTMPPTCTVRVHYIYRMGHHKCHVICARPLNCQLVWLPKNVHVVPETVINTYLSFQCDRG